MDPKAFRKLLRETRKKIPGLTQEALSDATGDDEKGITPVDAQTISNIERGITKDPGLFTVARLIEAMKMTPADFFLQLEAADPVKSGRRAGESRAAATSLPPGADHARSEVRPASAQERSDHDILILVATALMAKAKGDDAGGQNAKTGTRGPSGPRRPRRSR